MVHTQSHNVEQFLLVPVFCFMHTSTVTASDRRQSSESIVVMQSADDASV